MKITANRKEDIIRRRDEFDRRKAEVKRQAEEEYQRFREAEYVVTEGAKKELEDMFAKFNFDDLEIRVEEGRFRAPGISVTIRVNDRDHFNKNKALSWNYDARLGSEGEVIRETSSWSGLQATTPEQIADLEKTLSAIKMLAGLDWEKFLNRTMPNWEDYVKTEMPEDLKNRPNFEQELKDAELEDIIGKRKMIECKHFDSSWYNGNVFVAIVKATPSQYTIIESPSRKSSLTDEDSGYLYDPTEAFNQGMTHRVKKSAIVPVTPINVIEV